MAKSSAAAAPLVHNDGIEQWLGKHGLSFTKTVINLSEINRAESERNQARLKPIDEDYVLLYAQPLRDGAKFPPLVLYKEGSQYVVIDGNHRVHAADLADVGTFGAYIVKEPSPAQIRVLTFEANLQHGLPTTLHERIRQAILLVEDGASSTSSAETLGLDPKQVRYALDRHNSEKRLSSLGLRKIDRLTPTGRVILSGIRSDVVLKQAAELAMDASIAGDDLKAFVKAVNGRRNEKDQLAVVASERESRSGTIKITAGGRIPVPQRLVTLQRILSTLTRLDLDGLSRDIKTVALDNRPGYIRACDEAARVLIRVANEMKSVPRAPK